MNIPSKDLGLVLAGLKLLQDQKNDKVKIELDKRLSEAEKEFLAFAQKRLAEINALSDWDVICGSFRKYRCETNKPLLQNNLDFFLTLLFIATPEKSEGCDKFTKHLNNCFHCFTEFVEVTGGYYRGLKHLGDGENKGK